MDAAVAAARAAFDGGAWPRLTALERGKLADLIEEHVDLLTEIEVVDSGMLRPIARHTVA